MSRLPPFTAADATTVYCKGMHSRPTSEGAGVGAGVEGAAVVGATVMGAAVVGAVGAGVVGAGVETPAVAVISAKSM